MGVSRRHADAGTVSDDVIACHHVGASLGLPHWTESVLVPDVLELAMVVDVIEVRPDFRAAGFFRQRTVTGDRD